MASLKFTIPLILFAVILCTGLVCDAKINVGGNVGKVLRKGGSNQREFDYFQLSLVWPPTYCLRSDFECDPDNGCHEGSIQPSGFKIHGFWPDYDDGTWPSCCSGERFNLTVVYPWLGELDKYWPALRCNATSNCHGGETIIIWEHEWETHGTCAASVLGSQYNYFSTALDLYDKYGPLKEVLQAAGYEPSNNAIYRSEGIFSAIEKAFTATPQLECRGTLVEEVHLCFTKDFEPRDCAVQTSTEKSCPEYISLPTWSLRKSGHGETEVSESTLPSSI